MISSMDATSVKPEERCPIGGTHTRLQQGHRLWHQMQAEYTNPDAFCANLNATIQALRSVTFIIQKEHDAIPDFEQWYEGWRERMKRDPLMKWLVEARNRIEKEGDPKTYSSARVGVLAGWSDPSIPSWRSRSIRSHRRKLSQSAYRSWAFRQQFGERAS